MSAMLNLLPKIPQNILTQNCFYYNILQLLFPFWHVFFCIFRHFSCQRNLFTVSLANVLCFNTMPYFAGIDRHVPHTTQHGFGTVQSRHVKKTYLKNRKNVVFTPTERQTKFAKNAWQVTINCKVATLDKKMQEKQKNTTQNCFQVNLFYVKCKKNENTRNLQGKIYRKKAKNADFSAFFATDWKLFRFVFLYAKGLYCLLQSFLMPKLCPTCVVP